MSFSISNVTMNEGDSGTTLFDFTVTDFQQGEPYFSGDDVVYYATRDGSATVADHDYAPTTGTLTFTADVSTEGLEKTAMVEVAVYGDTKFEGDEKFYVDLYTQQTISVTLTSIVMTMTLPAEPSSAMSAAATVATSFSAPELVQTSQPVLTTTLATGTATIQNDDPAPTFSIANATNVVEGDQLVFVVSRSNDAQAPESVVVTTSDGSATAGRDYVAETRTLMFSQGMLAQTFGVQTMQDGLYNGPTPETVNVGLGTPTGSATLSPTAMTASGGIVDRDPAPTLALSPANVSHPEGDSGETDFVYTVTRTGDAQSPQTVGYGVTGSGQNPADAGDFVGGALPSGTLTFAMGQSAQTITVPVAGDTTYEQDEGFTVALGTPNFGAVAAGSATGTIVNDDPAPAPAPPPAPPPSPVPTPTPAPAAPDAVSIDDQVFFKDGIFTLSGTASSASGVASVEISAQVDGVATDLGSATVNADGSFSFSDKIGKHTQGFIGATETDGAGGQATSADPGFSLTGGLDGTYKAVQYRYDADGTATTASDRFKASGVQDAELMAPGQTFTSPTSEKFENPGDVFRNGGAPESTFVFDPGHGVDTVELFRVDNVDHDTLSFKGSDFGNSVADVLADTFQTPGGSSVIVDPASHDVVKLAGITKKDLATYAQQDITFHD